MATVEQVVLQAGHIRVSLEEVEAAAEKIGSPELDVALSALHKQLQQAWQMAKEHFEIPHTRAPEDKPPRPN